MPVGNAYPFLTMTGKLVSGWFLFCGAGVATERLETLSRERGTDLGDARGRAALVRENRDAAFYDGKIATDRYFVKHVLPEVDASARAIKSEDLSMMDIAEQSFAW